MPLYMTGLVRQMAWNITNNQAQETKKDQKGNQSIKIKWYIAVLKSRWKVNFRCPSYLHFCSVTLDVPDVIYIFCTKTNPLSSSILKYLSVTNPRSGKKDRAINRSCSPPLKCRGPPHIILQNQRQVACLLRCERQCHLSNGSSLRVHPVAFPLPQQ